MTTGCASKSRITQETERWRAVHSPGVQIMRGVSFACVIAVGGRLANFQYRQLPNWVGAAGCDIRVVTKIGFNIRSCRSHRFGTTRCLRCDKEIVVQSYSDFTISTAGCHAPRVRHACGTRMRCRATGVDVRDQRPEHQRQCQGQAAPALTFIPPLRRRLVPKGLTVVSVGTLKACSEPVGLTD